MIELVFSKIPNTAGRQKFMDTYGKGLWLGKKFEYTVESFSEAKFRSVSDPNNGMYIIRQARFSRAPDDPSPKILQLRVHKELIIPSTGLNTGDDVHIIAIKDKSKSGEFYDGRLVALVNHTTKWCYALTGFRGEVIK